MDAANPYSDIPFPDPVCKKHPDRLATEPMAFRMCDECHEDAKARYADQHHREYEIVSFEKEPNQTNDGYRTHVRVERWKE